MRKSSEPYIGTRTTFAGAYPQIKSVLIEYEQMESRLPKDRRKGILSEANIPPTLRCEWKQCHEGGFEIERSIISRMISEKMTEHQGTLQCTGHEMLGRKKGYHCTNYLQFTARITYHDDIESK